MRITEQQKQDVQRRILAEARALFARKDPADVSTRDVAAAADIAHGTLFNYFATKEALGLALITARIARAHERFRAKEAPRATLAEDLFALIAAELRELAPLRRLVAALLAALAGSPAAAEAERSPRALERALVAEVLARHGRELAPTAEHIHWSLYVGLLGFWAADSSPHREDTLALLDETTRVMAALAGNGTAAAKD